MPVTLFTGIPAAAGVLLVVDDPRVIQKNVGEGDVCSLPWSLSGVVVHVIALDTFVHDAVTATDNRLAVSL